MLAGHHTQTVLYKDWWYIVQIAGIRDQGISIQSWGIVKVVAADQIYGTWDDLNDFWNLILYYNKWIVISDIYIIVIIRVCTIWGTREVQTITWNMATSPTVTAVQLRTTDEDQCTLELHVLHAYTQVPKQINAQALQIYTNLFGVHGFTWKPNAWLWIACNLSHNKSILLMRLSCLSLSYIRI